MAEEHKSHESESPVKPEVVAERGWFDFLGMKKEEKPEEEVQVSEPEHSLLQTEFKKAHVSEPEPKFDEEHKEEEKKHTHLGTEHKEEEKKHTHLGTEFEEEKKHDLLMTEIEEKVHVTEPEPRIGEEHKEEEKKHSLLEKLHRSGSTSSSSSSDEEIEEGGEKKKKKKGLKEKISQKISGEKEEEKFQEDSYVPIVKQEEKHHQDSYAPIVKQEEKHHQDSYAPIVKQEEKRHEDSYAPIVKQEEKRRHEDSYVPIVRQEEKRHEDSYAPIVKQEEDTPVPKYEDLPESTQPEEKKGLFEKIKDKIPGHHKKADDVAGAPAPPAALSTTEQPNSPEKKGILEKIKGKIPGYHPKTEEEKREKEKEKGSTAY